jgi:hypothetical protein
MQEVQSAVGGLNAETKEGRGGIKQQQLVLAADTAKAGVWVEIGVPTEKAGTASNTTS